MFSLRRPYRDTTLPEWADPPIVVAIAEESLKLLAENEGRELLGATLLTVGHWREDEGEAGWENYGPLRLIPFADARFPLRQKLMLSNGGRFTLEWENLNDLDSGPRIVSEALESKS